MNRSTRQMPGWYRAVAYLARSTWRLKLCQ